MKKPKLDAIETFCCSKGVRLAKILSTPFDTYVRSGLGKKRLKCLKASLKEWGASLDRWFLTTRKRRPYNAFQTLGRSMLFGTSWTESGYRRCSISSLGWAQTMLLSVLSTHTWRVCLYLFYCLFMKIPLLKFYFLHLFMCLFLADLMDPQHLRRERQVLRYW